MTEISPLPRQLSRAPVVSMVLGIGVPGQQPWVQAQFFTLYKKVEES